MGKNVPGRGQLYLVPTHSEEDGSGGKEKSKGHIWQMTKTSNWLFGRVARESKPPTNVNVWSLRNGNDTLIGTECYGQMRQKQRSLASLKLWGCIASTGPGASFINHAYAQICA
jgi:hypothetical protein